ncbi:hypothetical protein V6N11_033750 [Hibiscus sabdariffa]|uniref:Receptor-like protein kinase n=1 Tax=Hibiscus sabdariffa TaxID=183260 RepID=A0ABR2S0F2_9ROSI
MLRRYRSDPSHILEPEDLGLNPDLSYEEEHVQILDRKVKRLRNKNVPLVKILLRNHKVEEATWEPEGTTREQYPHLFNSEKLEILKNSRIQGGNQKIGKLVKKIIFFPSEELFESSEYKGKEEDS